MKQTRQAVRAIKQSMFLRCLWIGPICVVSPKVAKASTAIVAVMDIFENKIANVNITLNAVMNICSSH